MVLTMDPLLIILLQLQFQQILVSNKAKLVNLKKNIFLFTMAILDGVLTYWLRCRMRIIQGLFLTSLL